MAGHPTTPGLAGRTAVSTSGHHFLSKDHQDASSGMLAGEPVDPVAGEGDRPEVGSEAASKGQDGLRRKWQVRDADRLARQAYRHDAGRRTGF